MEKIINALKTALLSNNHLEDALNKNSSLTWQASYPVAVVHDKSRIKDEKLIHTLEEEKLLDTNGYTPAVFDLPMIDLLRFYAPGYLKTVDILCLENGPHTSFTFKEKRSQDYWKKVENPGGFKASIQISRYDGTEDICQMESDLRNIMRNLKEVPSLKEIGFVWVAIVPKSSDLKKLFHHYFPEKYAIVANEEFIYIGWNNTLKEINMRYFVCSPT